MAESIAGLMSEIVGNWVSLLRTLLLLVAIPVIAIVTFLAVRHYLHLDASKLTISTKESGIELMSSVPDKDVYYLVISPQTGWQPTGVCVEEKSKLSVVAQGRVNIDFYGVGDQIQQRIKLEQKMIKSHRNLANDAGHTPEEYFSEKDWQTLKPRHYWSDPGGDAVVTPTSFLGRQKYKLQPKLNYGALIGTYLRQGSNDPDFEPQVKPEDVFLVGRGWQEENAPKGCLWLAVNDVVEPQDAFPNAKGVRVHDLFLQDNLGFYRVVITVPH